MKESAFISIGNLEPTVIESATYLTEFCERVKKIVYKEYTNLDSIKDSPTLATKVFKSIINTGNESDACMLLFTTGGVFYMNDKDSFLTLFDIFMEKHRGVIKAKDTALFITVRDLVVDLKRCSQFALICDFKDGVINGNCVLFTNGQFIPTVPFNQYLETGLLLGKDTVSSNENSDKGLRPIIYGTKLEEEKPHKGWFHKWVTYTDTDGSEELALVETEDGDMLETYTHKIKFTDRSVSK